jgi:hypothetical protein
MGSCSPEAVLPQFPQDLEEEVVRQIHRSNLKLDDLITSIYEAQAPSSQASDKENEPEQQARPHPLSKRLIRYFIIQVSSSKDCSHRQPCAAVAHVLYCPCCR